MPVWPLLQMLFFPDILLSVFTCSIAIVIILFSMEKPDYQLLTKTLADLNALKSSLQQEVKRQTKLAEDRREKIERLPQDVVRAEIAKGRGTQFDPQCVDIMLAMIDEDKKYIMREQ